MRHKSKFRNLFSCLALTAALLLALGPVITPVLSLSPKNYIEICTAYGIVKQAVADGFAAPEQDTPESRHDNRSGHCPFCSLRQFAALPPPASFLPSLIVLAVFRALPDEDRLTGFEFLDAYSPRAPPFPVL